MGIFATAKGGGQKQLPQPGTELARCYAVCDLGTQFSEAFNKVARKCRIYFELPNQQAVFDESRGKEPFTISKEFTLSLHKKAELRKVLESWRGRAFTDEELDKFDVTKLIGAPCMVSFVLEPRKDGDGQFVKLTGVQKVPAQFTAQMPPPIEKPWSYEISMGRNNTFNNMPDWLREKIAQCEEWKKPAPGHDATPAAPVGTELAADDVPF